MDRPDPDAADPSPMPWWSLNEMTEEDLRALYQYNKNLGPKSQPMPAYVPPKQEPRTPYINLMPQMPTSSVGIRSNQYQ